MSDPARDDAFVEGVLREVARQERRLPLVAVALAVSVLVLAVPGLIALLARPALELTLSLVLLSLRQAISAVSDNPLFWIAVVITLGWLGWLATRALGGRR